MARLDSPDDGQRGFSLRAKGFLIVAIPLLFEVIFAVLIIAMDHVARIEHEAALRGKEITASAYRVKSLLVDMETGIRGYVITAEPRFTQPYDQAIREVPGEIGRLHRLAGSRRQEVGKLHALTVPVLAFQTEQLELVASGRQTEAATAVASGTGKNRMDAFRGELDNFLATHTKVEMERARRSAVIHRRLRNVVLGGLSMNVVVAAGMAIFFTTSITRRLQLIVANTYRVERQEPLPPPIDGRDEIAALDGRFHEMAGALDGSRRELEAFSYSVSHDLRAPLRAVNGYAQMIEEDFAPKLDDEGRRYLATIRSEAGRMGQLIDDLLAFSHLNRNSLLMAPVDVIELAREAFTTVSGGRDSRIRLETTPAPPALADRTMLRQALTNLLSNAVKFSGHNPESTIDVGGSAADGENLYWVRDHGVGFDMRYAHKLFGVFQRLHAAEEFEGTGVGLAIVQRVIQRHGGRVWAESEEGSGATFYFTLPRPEESGDERRRGDSDR